MSLFKSNTVKLTLLLLAIISFISENQAQQRISRADTLRGSVTPERAWWDLNYYHLDIEVKPESKSIIGKNTVRYLVKKEHQVLHIDLQEPMEITQVKQDGKSLEVKKDGAAHFVQLQKKQIAGEYESIEISYEGQPKEAVRPPWDGGLTWSKDENDNWFIANSNQGIGSSIWWPSKDHPADEPDSMLISVEVPKHLMNVSNGQLRKVEELVTFNHKRSLPHRQLRNQG